MKDSQAYEIAIRAVVNSNDYIDDEVMAVMALLFRQRETALFTERRNEEAEKVGLD